MVRSGFKKWMWMTAGAAASMMLIGAAANSTDFMEQRRKFREQIKNKVDEQLDENGKYFSVIFKGEEGKYDFEVTAEDRGRLQAYMKSYFNCNDQALLERMADELNTGHYMLYKEPNEGGLNLKVIFLSPPAEYWQWLTDANNIEKMFHAYNFSVELYQPDADTSYTILQTEGSFWGITQSVSTPIFYVRDENKRTFTYSMPTQKELIEAVGKMPPIKPGRTRPAEKFIDACRTHPYFQQKKGGEYVVSDEDILDLFDEVVMSKDERCVVKALPGHWKVQDDYPYLVVELTLKTTVNMDALIPSALRFLAGPLEDIAQAISDEVSVKYVPLSMKNFRDHTREWTKTGGPGK